MLFHNETLQIGSSDVETHPKVNFHFIQRQGDPSLTQRWTKLF